MDGYCKDCKHWRDGECQREKWLDEKEKPSEDSFGVYVYAHDDSGLYIIMRTGPMFGCRKFASR